MNQTSKLLTQLKHIGTQSDEEIQLAKVALILGALDHPDTDLDTYQNRSLVLYRK